MSSPIANQKPTLLQRCLVGLHQKSAHASRIFKLSEALGGCMGVLAHDSEKPILALDVGCGDMTLAESISSKNAAFHWTCTDIHDLPPQLQITEKWKKYRRFDGITLPFGDGEFDVVLFSDVLHHCLPKAESLLSEAARVGRFVVIKDHFEYGFYSRQMLRLLDFVGNYGYGVVLPQRYFTRESFHRTFRQAGLKEHAILNNLDLYSEMPLLRWFLRKSWQFIAVLEKA